MQEAEFGGNEKKNGVQALPRAVFDEKEPQSQILPTWMLDTWAQMWMFRQEEVNLLLFCFALPLLSEEELPIKLFLDAL